MANKKIVFKQISPKIIAVARKHGHRSEEILEMLLELQEARGSVTHEMLGDLARLLNIPASRVYGIASFYSMLELADSSPLSAQQKVSVCDGPVCWLCGGNLKSSKEDLTEMYPEMKVKRTSCLGLCDHAPAILVDNKQTGPIQGLNSRENLLGNTVRSEIYSQARPGEVRVMLDLAGKVDPDSLDSALLMGVYQGLNSALKRTPKDVIQEVENSNLNGRGGAGFPVGKKWRFVAAANQTPKFVVCNADESEPMIFKDRVLIDTNPHQILEGMAIAAYAVGASSGYIYIRGEYFSQAKRLERAIEQAEKSGWLGNDIAGSGFAFKVHVHSGAGAYICGEETALIESLEGKRGEPRIRPPYPTTSGFHNLPTLVNNVESFASIPHILQRGSDWYKNLSNNSAGGTKLYIILGHINHPGLFEAPFGLTLREIIENFGMGLRQGSRFNFALCGGAAGTIVGERFLDIPIDYSSAGKGISLGAGAFLVCDENISVVELLRELMHFFTVESCGKCTPCREGTRYMYELLVRLSEGRGRVGDLEELTSISRIMQTTSFCGLGQSVNMPVISAMTNFRNEFEVEIRS
jgi:NADH:ubiquinone oxidoreductase subunit F (NADH-binding)/NADH:ubiquinone oxidoreductase subunit E